MDNKPDLITTIETLKKLNKKYNWNHFDNDSEYNTNKCFERVISVLKTSVKSVNEIMKEKQNQQ